MFTPYEKMSKKQQKELNNQKRVTWGFQPVTRVKQSGKAYNRKKDYFKSQWKWSD